MAEKKTETSSRLAKKAISNGRLMELLRRVRRGTRMFLAETLQHPTN